MTTGLYIWYYFSALVLAALLFRPVRNLIVAGRVRGLERREKRPATEAELQLVRKKSVPLAAVIVVTFSLIFTKFLVIKLYVPEP